MRSAFSTTEHAACFERAGDRMEGFASATARTFHLFFARPPKRAGTATGKARRTLSCPRMNRAAEPVVEQPLYTRLFFVVFAAVALFMTGVALRFHMGQYIAFRGYNVDALGWMLAGGAAGALLIRFQMGRWIDRFGCKPNWLAGTLLTSLAVGAMPFARRLWLIATLHVVAQIAVGVTMTTVAVFAAQIAVPRRRAESIGIMGLAGFLGMMVGPTLGDVVFAGDTAAIEPYLLFFGLSAGCSLLAGVVVAATPLPSFQVGRLNAAGEAASTGASSGLSQNPLPNVAAAPMPELAAVERPNAVKTLRILRRHWPGAVLLLGAVFGAVFCMQSAFLERLAERAGFRDIKLFFVIYGPTAMMLRILFRRLPERLGRGRTLTLGTLLLAAGLGCLLGIGGAWQLVPAALLMGAGHCFVFPSLVDLAASRLPPEHRGLGTSLILGSADLGMLIGFGSLGMVIDRFGFNAAIGLLIAGLLIGAANFERARRRAAVTAPAPP